MPTPLWSFCLERLEHDLAAQQFNTWIRPLQVVANGNALALLAPNRFVRDHVKSQYLERIAGLASTFSTQSVEVLIDVGSENNQHAEESAFSVSAQQPIRFEGRLNPTFTFNSHV